MAEIRRRKGRSEAAKAASEVLQTQDDASISTVVEKKPFYKKPWFIALAVILLLAAIGSIGNRNKTDKADEAEKPAETTTVAPTEQSTKDEKAADATETAPSNEATPSNESTPSNAIKLVAGKENEYSQVRTLNAGTEFEESALVYYVPSGTYDVTNVGSKKTQVSIYEGVAVNEDGWEEVANTGDILLLEANQTGQVTIPEGYYVDIYEPSEILLVPQGEASDSEMPAEQPAEAAAEQPEDQGVPSDHRSALSRAEAYSNMMNMSKKAIYDQLVSEYGDKFSPEAAQYAVDNLEADYNANALAKAKSYSDMMYMSKQAIYDQLISEYGEQFTAEEAQYAVDNLEADYSANALEKAKMYRDEMSMSPSAIYDQLVSEYGEQFTPEEAQYAIDNLG